MGNASALMKSPFLTGSSRRADDRRAAIRLMTILGILVVSPLAPARADEGPPRASLRASLIERASAARWLPQLTLGTRLSRARWSLNAADETVVYGALAWPLERPPATVPALHEQRMREAERQSHVARLADAWHRRRIAEDKRDDVAAELAVEEADAMIDALDEDGP